jgi:hypothetical protein
MIPDVFVAAWRCGGALGGRRLLEAQDVGGLGVGQRPQ